MKFQVIALGFASTLIGSACSRWSAPESTPKSTPAPTAATHNKNEEGQPRPIARNPRNFRADAKVDPSQAQHWSAIASSLQLGAQQMDRIREQGFVVTYQPFGYVPTSIYSGIYEQHLPVFISADSILYAFHRNYRSTLKQIEAKILHDELVQMFAQMHQELKIKAKQRRSKLQFEGSWTDADIIITVARSLIGDAVPPALSNTPRDDIQAILRNIKAKKTGPLKLSGLFDPSFDYSQFATRGHYRDSEKLGEYFQALMWLGRLPLEMVTFDKNSDHPILNRKAFESAALLSVLAHSRRAEKHYRKINETLKRFVGNQDNVSPESLADFLKRKKLKSLRDIARVKANQLQQWLLEDFSGSSRIQSQIRYREPTEHPYTIPVSFSFLGQRFTIDSYVLQNVVYDKLTHPESKEKTKRMLPSGLDVMAALGQERAETHLQAELEHFGYGQELMTLKNEVHQLRDSFWTQNVYHSWLHAIKGFSDDPAYEKLPPMFQTASWQDKVLNTQLASWAELRHDHILYAKQSYSMSISCEYPDAYVEPTPLVFERIATTAQIVVNQLKALKREKMPISKQKIENFSFFHDTALQLATIARKQIHGEAHSQNERNFLKAAVEKEMIGCGETHWDGWYPKLVGGSDEVFYQPTIADIHTAPTDAFGNLRGDVLHAGTGPFELAVMAFECRPGQPLCTFVGPVSSYHEKIAHDFKRLQDGSWANMLRLDAESTRPSWTRSFRLP